jgi:primase-polymerase (primpol)-like protein
LPAALIELRRWALADGKRPVKLNGRAASSTEPATWCDYMSVIGKPHGIMLGDGLACWDLDDVIAEDDTLHHDAIEVLAGIADPIWIERSMSGRGLHVFVKGEGPSSQSSHVSYYSWGRFIVVTGDRYSIPTRRAQ